MESTIQPYLYYLILGESIFVQIAYSIVIVYNIKSLFWVFTDLHKRKVFISPILIFHSILWVVIAASTLCHNTYVLALWRPDAIIYDSAYFYLSAMAYFCFMPAAAVCLFFSTLERCIVFCIHNRLKLQRIQAAIFVINVIVVAAVIGIMVGAVVVSVPKPFPLTPPSLSPGNMAVNNLPESRRNLFRLINTGLNFFAVTILTILIRKTKLVSTLSNHRDVAYLVQKILLIHTTLDFFIQGIAVAVTAMTGASASNVLGSYSRALSALDGLLCCMIFVRSVSKLRQKSIQLQTTSSNNFKTKVFKVSLVPRVS